MTSLELLRTKPVPTPFRKPKPDVECCVACNRALSLSPGAIVQMIRMEQDRTLALHRGDFGAYPLDHSGFEFIGPECARKFGPDFVFTEAEGMYFCDSSFPRPHSLGPASQVEIDHHRLNAEEIATIEKSSLEQCDLPDGWRRDLHTGRSLNP